MPGDQAPKTQQELDFEKGEDLRRRIIILREKQKNLRFQSQGNPEKATQDLILGLEAEINTLDLELSKHEKVN